MDVWDYFHQKEDEFRRNSVFPDRHMFQATPGSEDRRGRVFGNLNFSDNAYLSVLEFVVVRANRYIHREKYAYFLVIGSEEIGGYERDRTHSPPVHRHCGLDHTRSPAKPIALKGALDLAWDYVSKKADWSDYEERRSAA